MIRRRAVGLILLLLLLSLLLLRRWWSEINRLGIRFIYGKTIIMITTGISDSVTTNMGITCALARVCTTRVSLLSLLTHVYPHTYVRIGTRVHRYSFNARPQYSIDYIVRARDYYYPEDWCLLMIPLASSVVVVAVAIVPIQVP